MRSCTNYSGNKTVSLQDSNLGDVEESIVHAVLLELQGDLDGLHVGYARNGESAAGEEARQHVVVRFLPSL